MKTFAAVLVGLAILAVWPAAARANDICSNGPTRPGERQVGVTHRDTASGVAPMPVCAMDSAPQTEGAPTPRMAGLSKIDTYLAVALHPSANEPWAIWNNPYSEENAKARVLDACKAAMGDGCEIVGSGKNSAVALGYAGGLLAQAAWGETRAHAEKNVVKRCRDNGQRCKVEVVFSTRQDFDLSTDLSATYYPTRDTVRRLDAPAKRAVIAP